MIRAKSDQIPVVGSIFAYHRDWPLSLRFLIGFEWLFRLLGSGFLRLPKEDYLSSSDLKFSYYYFMLVNNTLTETLCVCVCVCVWGGGGGGGALCHVNEYCAQ